MGERFATRALVVSRALAHALRRRALARPSTLRRILVAHELLLGDTIMLTPLLAKLSAVHPQAEVTMLAPPAFVPLYATRPYGVRTLAFRRADSATARALLEEDPFDLAFVVGDNRYSWLAAAMRARHIVAHAGDAPWTKQWFVDEERAYPGSAAAWGDLVAQLVDGPEPAPYAKGDWPAPHPSAFEKPASRYAVLHVGASTPLKYWLPQRWMELAQWLAARGIEPVWSGGRGEEAIVAACDPRRAFRSYAGKLDLVQVRALIEDAAALVAPDTGVAHLGRIAFRPTVVLYGPGSSVLAGPGRFWRDTPSRSITIDEFPCRDQRLLFRRELDWVRRCGRTTAECAEPRCMNALSVESVISAVNDLIS